MAISLSRLIDRPSRKGADLGPSAWQFIVVAVAGAVSLMAFSGWRWPAGTGDKSVQRGSLRLRTATLLADRSGNVILLASIALPIVLGMVGLALEGASWQRNQRLMQNAADAAVLAAASNNRSTTVFSAASYVNEAKAAAAKYGFTNGSNNVTVTVSNAATCPSGQSPCYSVTITKKMPLVFSELVGYVGDTTIGTTAAKLLTSVAKATPVTTTATHNYCIVALDPISNAVDLTTNGAPSANLAGCNIYSASNMNCNGHNLNANYGDAVGSNNGCGVVQDSNVTAISDPYSSLASNIPATSMQPCASYPQETPYQNKNNPASTVASNQISGSITYQSATAPVNTKIFCGDVVMTGDVTLTGTNIIVIRNGQLDTNGHTLQTASGASLTLIFTGTNGGSYSHVVNSGDGGTLDIAAPTSGTWSGVSLYTDPALTTGVDVAAAGNSPTWDMTGLIYMPNASVTWSGAINKATNGQACVDLVVYTLLVNGTANIMQNDIGSCAAAGLTMPQGTVTQTWAGRAMLVS